MRQISHLISFCLLAGIASLLFDVGAVHAQYRVHSQVNSDSGHILAYDAHLESSIERSNTGKEGVSGKKAFLLSMILPGLGHRYINRGRWNGWGAAFSLADAGLWISLFGGEWHQDHLVDSYTSLAATGAGADVTGKNRTFFLNLASFRSSDEFLQTVLRNRAWDQIGYVSDPSFQWKWDSEADFERFRSLRSDAESVGRRSSVLIAALVVNRLVSGLLASRNAGRINRLKVALGPPEIESRIPSATLALTF